MSQTLYRRPLPSQAIAFSSPEGRRVFAEALATDGLKGYFPLAEQFHTQSDPAFCGLGSLVVALNALAIDPERLWKGPWRWFAEDLLDCCVPLAEVRERGLDIDELGCLARCNGAEVNVHRADAANPASWRDALALAGTGEAVIVASYDRAALGQTGGGHFSPIGGYHETRDLALILDVARFKYPPHWVSARCLWHAMEPVDPATGRARGWLVMRRRARSSALGFSLSCVGESWRGLSRRLTVVMADLAVSSSPAALARAVLPLVPHLEVRRADTAAHQETLAAARVALRSNAIYSWVREEVGSEHADAVTLLLFALVDRLTPGQRAKLGTLNGTITEELTNLRAQLEALTDIQAAATNTR
ncbi:MAG TPA: phytochelatin synthase family protein [Steroidobacteraceae bacterium]|nr:phytochelatin synthase family protein [Steroidobacteraceae bacterium]